MSNFEANLSSKKFMYEINWSIEKGIKLHHKYNIVLTNSMDQNQAPKEQPATKAPMY